MTGKPTVNNKAELEECGVPPDLKERINLFLWMNAPGVMTIAQGEIIAIELYEKLMSFVPEGVKEDV